MGAGNSNPNSMSQFFSLIKSQRHLHLFWENELYCQSETQNPPKSISYSKFYIIFCESDFDIPEGPKGPKIAKIKFLFGVGARFS